MLISKIFDVLPRKRTFHAVLETVLGSSGVDHRPLAHLAAIEHHPSRGLNAFSQIVKLSLPKIKSVGIDGAALQERASLGCARCVE